MIEVLNNVADKWFNWELAMLWQVTVLVAIIWMIDLLIRKWAWPQVRYVLWLLVLVLKQANTVCFSNLGRAVFFSAANSYQPAAA